MKNDQSDQLINLSIQSGDNNQHDRDDNVISAELTINTNA